ncbi:helix-turn-helix domain-containing protein [Veillonella ratti]|uniref:helix-turn-helix domain-containing protein n=1 Tax=Veillonella ratti TaxID=103892 RepID=UPI000F8C4964|nr:helix-turn-helix domain-containing protein [Veillonella ratti]
MKAIEEVMTTKEAAQIWGKVQAVIQQNCLGQKGKPPRFTEDECRKSGGTWLVTRTGMVRLYGEPEIEE